ncbi:MAG: alpha/beta hydrolase [Pseudomonadota bacterium]
MSPEPDTLFDGDLLRASVFRAGRSNGALIVTFRHRVADAGDFYSPKPRQRFLDAGWTHLHIQSRCNDWFVNAETSDLCAVLADLAAGFTHRAGIGFSMGGYGVLRFSAALALDEVVAISPQVSIAPSVVPHDPRFRDDAAGFDPSLGDLAIHARRGLRGAVIFDPFRALDRMNADMIGALLPDLALCRYGFGGHPAMAVLRETVGFGPLMSLVLHRKLTPQAVLALHRDNRAASPSWWRHMARRAAATGRPRLAGTALRHARS